MIYQFNEFRLNPDKKLFYRDGELLEVENRVFQFILLLLERYPETLTRRELLETLWPRQEISDWALSQLIRRSRQLLGDDSRHPTYIKTIHGVGVRFLVQPELLAEDSPAVEPRKQAADKSRRWPWVALGLALVAVLAAYLFIRPGKSPPLDLGDYPYTIAVLPFENGSGDKTYDWVRLGLMDIVRQLLGESAGINTVETKKVIGYLDNMDLEEASSSPIEMLKAFESLCGDLGCQILLSARLERTDPHPQISYQVVSSRGVAKRKTVNGNTVIEAGSALAGSVVRLVDPAQPWLVSVRDTYSTDEAANQAYALGIQELFNGQYVSAAQFLELALKKEPEFVWAWVKLADARYRMPKLDEALKITDGLLARDDLPPDVRYQALRVVSNVQYTKGELGLSRETSRRLLKMAEEAGNVVDQAMETMNIGTSYQAAGDVDRALEYLLKAMELYRRAGYRPGIGMVSFNIGNIHMTVNDYTQAEKYYKDAELQFLRLGNRQYLAMTKFQQAVILKSKGELGRAVSMLTDLQAAFEKLGGTEGAALVRVELADIHIMEGKYEVAVNEISKMLPDFERQGLKYAGHMAANLLARAYLNLHLPDQARKYLQTESEFSTPDPTNALLPAHLAYEEKRFADAVDIARSVKKKAGSAWLAGHEKYLQAYETALSDQKWREIIF